MTQTSCTIFALQDRHEDVVQVLTVAVDCGSVAAFDLEALLLIEAHCMAVRLEDREPYAMDVHEVEAIALEELIEPDPEALSPELRHDIRADPYRPVQGVELVHPDDSDEWGLDGAHHEVEASGPHAERFDPVLLVSGTQRPRIREVNPGVRIVPELLNRLSVALDRDAKEHPGMLEIGRNTASLDHRQSSFPPAPLGPAYPWMVMTSSRNLTAAV